MTNPNGAKGSRAERELAGLLGDLLGFPCRRKLGAGRSDDVGDIDIPALPELVIQVANHGRALDAVRAKPREAEVQRANAGAIYAATFIRLHRSPGQPDPWDHWRVVLTLGQFATYVREAMCGDSAIAERAAMAGPDA